MSDAHVTLTSPLSKGLLLPMRVIAYEEFGRPFQIDLELLSEDPGIKLEDVLGKSMTVHVDLPSGKVRHFNGLTSRFSHTGRMGRYSRYQATLRPWLWLLTRTADCRIFPVDQGAMTVPEIVKDVFRQNGFSDFKELLHGTYEPREFCVQYRETDFNFVSRLMEEEGVYYYFEHEDGKHTLVMADGSASHKPIPGCEEVPYMAASAENASRIDHIEAWIVAQELQSGMLVLNDFDFEKPGVDIMVRDSVLHGHAHAKLEVYDYPGFYVGQHNARGAGTEGDPDGLARGRGFARTRIEELHTDYEQVRGSGSVRGLSVGGLFKLSDFHRADQNRDHLVVSTTLRLEVGRYASIESAPPEDAAMCEFTAIPAKTPFRSRRITPWPSISGPQTATVVGKAGEEIWTDVHGRVKVQFHWDRQGGRNESSSCWVRVAHPWAGKEWGMVHVPRIGHEVVVEFLEGNPDRPIITGSVYNGTNKPPYKLPDNQTQSGIKSRSTQEGSFENFNEIRFEDKKGEEELFIHAEKDQKIEVENDESHWVGHDRSKGVDNDETTKVKNNRTESVGKNESITIGGNRTESVDKDESISIGGSRTETVTKDETLSVGGSRTRSVDKDESITVGKNQTTRISEKRTEQVGKDESVSVGDNRSHSVGKNDALDVGKKLVINAGDEISIQTGSAKLVLKKDGTIQLQGGSIAIKASGNLTLKGAKVAQN